MPARTRTAGSGTFPQPEPPVLEQLSEQLVDLERSPGDTELLNAIFRGFHTVKGGAGFLQFEPMVDCCHVAENVFDTLRKGECELTTELMDTVLKANFADNTASIQSACGVTCNKLQFLSSFAAYAPHASETGGDRATRSRGSRPDHG